MPKNAEKSLVVGLDIGTSKIVAIVGEMQSDGGVEVIGLGSHPSHGLKRGVVVIWLQPNRPFRGPLKKQS